MKTPDEIVLKALKPFMTDDAYAYVIEKTKEAGGIRELTDITALMQLELAKRGFGGNRSAAAAYAADVRWGGKQKEFMTGNKEGVKQRSATIGGVNTQFNVKEIKISDVKTGNIISLGSNRIPQKVTAIGTQNGRTAIATQDLSSNRRFQSVVPDTAMGRLWTPVSEQDVTKLAFGNRSAAGAYAANVRWGGASIGTKAESIGVSVNGAHTPVNFDVVETEASNVKFGDTIMNSKGQAAWVTGMTTHPSDSGYDHIITSTPVAYTTGKKGQLQHALPHDFHNTGAGTDRLNVPAGTVGPKVKVLSATGLGKTSAPTSGRSNPNQKIDSAKITAADHAFIAAGSSGPERVRRRTTIIEHYATQGKDVTTSGTSGTKGGAQWLGTMNQ